MDLKVLLQRLLQEIGAAIGEGVIQPGVAVVRDVNIAVPQKAGEIDSLGFLVDGHQDHGVRAAYCAGDTGVGADQQNVVDVLGNGNLIGGVVGDHRIQMLVPLGQLLRACLQRGGCLRSVQRRQLGVDGALLGKGLAGLDGGKVVAVGRLVVDEVQEVVDAQGCSRQNHHCGANGTEDHQPAIGETLEKCRNAPTNGFAGALGGCRGVRRVPGGVELF